MKKTILIFAFAAGIAISGTLNAQVTIGSNALPDGNAVLDLKNTADPNASTKGLLLPRVALTSTTVSTPLTAHVAGMTVYNTATAGTAPNNVTPGYYYNDGTKWVRLLNAAPSTEPWYNVATNTGATSNTQDIYQTGSVGIGASPLSGVKLHVATQDSKDVVFSRFLSSPINDDMDLDFVRGYGSLLAPAVVADSAARIGGIRARTYIDPSKLLTDPTNAFRPSAEISFETDGTPSTTSSPGRILFLTTPVGSTSGSTRMTIEKNGYVGINNVHPTNTLHVSATANPLRLEGLQAATTSTDSVMMVDGQGVVKYKKASTIAASTEPWYDVATLAGATSNTQNIYQMGRVGMGTNAPTAPLHVLNPSKVESNNTFYTTLITDTLAKTPTTLNMPALFARSYTSASDNNAHAYLTASSFSSYNYGTGTITAQRGLQGGANHYGSGTVTLMDGGIFNPANRGTGIITTQNALSAQALNYSSGKVEASRGLYSIAGNTATATGTVTNAVGVHSSIINDGTNSTVTNGYGIWIGIINATTRWSLYAMDENAPSFLAGSVKLGGPTTTATEKLDVAGAIKVSTTYQATTITNGSTTPVPAGGAGTIVFQNSHFFGWTGSTWKQLDNL
ncbi:MAG: hypothetical protein ACK5KP_10205 [Paludibacteraceae bacterium]